MKVRAQLRTDRLELSLFTASDLDGVHRLFSDAATHSIGAGPHHDLQETRDWIERRQRAYADHGLAWYAVRLTGQQSIIGNCGLLVGRKSAEEPEIGYEIDAALRGRRYASEAVAAVLRESDLSGPSKLWATVRPGNLASLAILRRSGFVQELVESPLHDS